MRILIVEDDTKTSAYLRKGLSENGFVADVAGRASDALELVCRFDYGIIILDVMLPEEDGWTVYARIRENGVQAPVLFLTARDSVEDRVRGLELGADDYLIKPFAFSELLARVRTIIRRGPARGNDEIKVADLVVDFSRFLALREGRALDLTPREFALLHLLARRSGEVLTRTMIAEQVWDMNFDSDANVVDVAIRRLRMKVDDPFTKKLIQTVRGVGYVLRDGEDGKQ